MRHITVILLLSVLLGSCFPDEQPWERSLVNPGEIIGLGSDYRNQIFYDLGSASVVSTNAYDIWDIGFNSQGDDFFVVLNAARQMGVYDTGSTNFDAISEISSSWEKRYDNPSGGNTHMAIDIVLNANEDETVLVNSNVYIIERGIDSDGGILGSPIKFTLEKIENNSYYIRFANLNGSEERSMSIAKDPSVNFVPFSFTNPEVIPIVEPDRNTWDIVFTRFTDTVYTVDGYDYLIGYAVTGAYLNQAFTEAYLVTDFDYDYFSDANVEVDKFTNRLNVIGHEWKLFQDVYTVFDDKVYIIKDKDGLIYKLHFLGFYNPESGLKGYPEIEFELL